MEKDKEKETLDQMYLEQIEALKMQMESMVPGPEHDKLKAEHKKLLEDYVNRRPQPKQEIVKEEKSAKELSQFFSQKTDLSNREYWVKALEYRKSYLKEFGKDPFDGTSYETSDPRIAANVADTIQNLLDQYEDPTEFRIKFNTVLQDPIIRR